MTEATSNCNNLTTQCLYDSLCPSTGLCCWQTSSDISTKSAIQLVCLFSVLTSSTKHSITQNPISSEILQSCRAVLLYQYVIRRAFLTFTLLNNIRLYIATMMMEECDIVQTVQFLFSASQQIYLAQVTEHISNLSTTCVHMYKCT